MSLMSKTKTVTHSVRKDIPTPRVPIRSGYHTWKVSKSDTIIPRTQSKGIGSIQTSLDSLSSNLTSNLNKSHDFYSLHQSSNIPCSLQRSSYSSVTTTKTIASNLNNVKSDTSTTKAVENIDAAAKIPASIAINLNPVKSNVVLSERSTLKSHHNIDGATTGTTTTVSNRYPVKSKATLSGRTTLKCLQNNDIATARPALRDCSIVTNTSSTKSKIVTSSHKVIVKKTLDTTDEELSPQFQQKSIIDDMNILKTPVNDSLTRKIILTNVVPVTSLITTTQYHQERTLVSNGPTARHALRGDEHCLNPAFSKLDDSLTQVEEAQTLNSMVAKDISDACIHKDTIADTHTSLTPKKGSESTVLTGEDEPSTNMEIDTPMNFSRQETESFLIQVENPESSLLVEDKEENSKTMPGLRITDESDEFITSISTEADLTKEDVPIEMFCLNDTNEENLIKTNTNTEISKDLQITSSKTKRELYKDNATSEILLPTSGIIIDLPPLISPMNSDNTKADNNVNYMIPDSTTDVTVNNSKSRNKTANIKGKTSLIRKVQNRQTSIKRKLRDTSSPKCPCDNNDNRESNKRARGRPRKNLITTAEVKEISPKSKTPRKKKISSKSEINYEYVSETPTIPKTRNMMINPRTRNVRSPLLLTKD